MFPLLARDLLNTPIPALRPDTTSVVTYSSASVASSAFGVASPQAPTGNSVVVRLLATTDCHIAIGAAPTATASSCYLPAGIPEYVRVGVGEKVAVIREAADGKLYLTEMV